MNVAMKTHDHDMGAPPTLHRSELSRGLCTRLVVWRKRFGWSLRYKKSKYFCNLIREKGQTKVLLVFGRDEREKIEVESSKMTPEVKAAYEAAPTFHDGKWMALVVDSSAVMTDVEFLLKLKRKPNKTLSQTTLVDARRDPASPLQTRALRARV